MADAVVSPTGLRMIKLLVGRPPQSVAELTTSTNVTRTAICLQLKELLRAGFVECRNDHPSGRGRPRILYTATDAALRLFHVHGPCLVVPALLHTIKGLAGVNSFNGTVSSVGKIVAEHYLSKITARKPEARLQQMADLMNAEGGLIETSRENGRFVVCRRSCPFVGMNDGEFSMCQVDLELMSRVARKSLRRITYRHAGGPCCTFVVANPHDHCG